jgi:hypothetical protein
MPRLGLAATAAGLILMLHGAAIAQRSGSFVGTWTATDAVDDYERAAVIVIRTTAGGYQLIDRGSRPAQILRGKARGGRLTFASRRGGKATRLVFTLANGGRGLTEDRYDGSQHIAVHYVRESRRAHRRR